MQTIPPLSADDPARQQAVLPVHTHELTPDEVRELGLIAVEEPHASPVVPETGIPPIDPATPAAVVAPQAPPPTKVKTVPEPPAAPPVSPAPAVAAAPAAPVIAPVPAAAPKATPSKAPDVAPPSTSSTPVAPPDEKVSERSDQPAASVVPQAAQPAIDPTMAVSANTQDLKSVARLRTIGLVMNVTVIVLILSVLAGGWYVYKQLTGGALELF